VAESKTCIEDGCQEYGGRQKRCDTHYRTWLRRQTKCKAEGCKSLPAAHGYCRPHEQLALTSRSPKRREASLARFREGIEADWETGCWMWVERPNEDGYGQMHAGGHWYSHRFSYVWFFGGHGRRLTLDHLCNVRRCVRPDHLWPVSNTLNSQLRHARALAGALAYWQDAAGVHARMRNIEAWAIANDLPYGELPPFGRDGQKPPRAHSLDLLPHLFQFPAAARLHPSYDALRIGQNELFRPAGQSEGRETNSKGSLGGPQGGL
jgi:hypothetical protein